MPFIASPLRPFGALVPFGALSAPPNHWPYFDRLYPHGCNRPWGAMGHPPRRRRLITNPFAATRKADAPGLSPLQAETRPPGRYD